jgi:dCTP deaminase
MMSQVMSNPWSDWIPGVLSKRQLRELCGTSYIIGAKDNGKSFDHSSMDLTLSDEAYLLTKGAIKPQDSYLAFVNREKDLISAQEQKDGRFLLERKKTYVFKLQQRLNTDLKTSPIYGQATAKSSIGRLDVLARLVVDGMDRYECFIPTRIASGEMFLEITPLTFNVYVRPGDSLSQLRLFYGRIENSIIRGEELFATVLPGGESDGCLTVDLSDTRAGKRSNEYGTAFQADYDVTKEPICLWETSTPPDPKKYWKLLKAERIGTKNRILIEQDAFYILRSKQKIALTGGVAVYCRATDETIGEMRIHYAGFVHPYFGRERSDGTTGTPLIFEVRGHDLPVILNNEEKMAQLVFYRMSEDCKRDEEEVQPVTVKGGQDYSEQTLQLSKFFADWT